MKTIIWYEKSCQNFLNNQATIIDLVIALGKPKQCIHFHCANKVQFSLRRKIQGSSPCGAKYSAGLPAVQNTVQNTVQLTLRCKIQRSAK
jgi:hypothetical protein